MSRDLVSPRRPDRRVMESNVRIVGQPVAYLRREVRAQVVHHDMNLTIDVLAATVFNERKKLF
jgi:hypothetical protein